MFPLPPKGTRKVRIAYDQVLPESGGRVRYVYPLAMGTERATDIEDFALHVQASDTRCRLEDPEVNGYRARVQRSGDTIEVDWASSKVRPAEDFVFTYGRSGSERTELSAFVPSWGEAKQTGLEGAAIGAQGAGYFALRLSADLPALAPPVPHIRQDRILVVDSSHGQSRDSLEGGLRVALGLVRRMDPDERFAVLACDSACSSFPDEGLASLSDPSSVGTLERWAQARAPAGSSDIAGALIAAMRRLEGVGAQPSWGGSPASAEIGGGGGNGAASVGPGQVVYIGDGAPSSGELTAETIAARVQSLAGPKPPDWRLLGLGRSVDDMTWMSLARLLGATYESLQGGGSLDQRIGDVALGLRSPVIVGPRIELPPGLGEAYPSSLPNLRLGQQVVLVGRLLHGGPDAPTEVRLAGMLAGQPYTLSQRITLAGGSTRQNPLVPRLWAQARIAELEGQRDDRAVATITELSKQYHVMSRYTSLLVLENDAMYSEFGIKRTKAGGSLSDLAAPAAATAVAPTTGPLAPAEPMPEEQGARRQPSAGQPPSAQEAAAARSEDPIAAQEHEGLREKKEATASGMARSSAAAPAARARAAEMAPLQAPPPPAAAPAAPAGPAGQAAKPWSDEANGPHPNPFPGEPSNVVRGTVVSGVLPAVAVRAVPVAPTATHVEGNDLWMAQGEDELARLRTALAQSPESRKRFETLVRGLLTRGRFDEALAISRRLIALDPDSTISHELLSYSAVAAGDPHLAVMAVDAQAETDPRNAKWHARAARAFEALRDERRACAHWRSLAELQPGTEEFVYESLRCRARLLSDRGRALREARAFASPGASMAALTATLESGIPGSYDRTTGRAGAFEAEIACASDARCPSVLVVAPNGTVFSPYTPTDARSSRHSVALSLVRDGTYRTVLAGPEPADPATVTVRALGVTKRFRLAPPSGAAAMRKTIAMTRIQHPPASPPPVLRSPLRFE